MSASKHTPGPWHVSDQQGWKLDVVAPWGEKVKAAQASGYGDYRGIIVCEIAHQNENPCVSKTQAKANADLIASAPAMFVAIAKLACPACEHELQHHADKYGCEIERGDGYRKAEFQEALGPCGCNDDDLRDDYPDFLRALDAFRLANSEKEITHDH